MSEEQNKVDTIQMKCSDCNATMEVDPDKTLLYCPYCGSRKLIVESDAVKMTRIQTEAYKSVEMSKIQREKEQADEQKAEEFRKSKLAGWCIAFTVICIVLAIIAFSNGSILSGIIAVIQVSLFSGAWILGFGLVKLKIKNLHIPAAILGFILIIAYLFCLKYKVPDRKPVKRPDVIVEEAETETTEPRTTKETTKPTTAATTEETPEETTEETTTEPPTTPAPTEPVIDSGTVRPDVKAAIDSIEAFYDEYIVFMNEYNASGGSLSMLAEYMDYMGKLVEMSEKMDAIGDGDLTDAELAYYLEAQGRINAKLYQLAY